MVPESKSECESRLVQKLLKEVAIDQHICCVNNHALHHMAVLPMTELMANY